MPKIIPLLYRLLPSSALRSKLRQFYFNLRYLRKPPWDTGISPPELKSFIRNHPPGRALDMGCGTGTNVITLAKHGWDVVGVDFVPRAIKKARRKVRREGVEANLLVDDVTELEDVRAPFDLILDIGCLHALPQGVRMNYLDNVDRLLASEGTYLVYAFLRDKSQEQGTGIGNIELESLDHRFDLISRKDTFERQRKPSVWLTYHSAQKLQRDG
jgi:cyclopropane fatty-acyl-phospholipid synthase-like methyltransferase